MNFIYCDFLKNVVTQYLFLGSTSLELAEICKDVGLPSGILNVLTGYGPEAGAPLASHPHVDKVSLSLLASTCILKDKLLSN